MIISIKSKLRALLAVTVILFSACGSGKEDSEAYGNFEADEVIVSAQVQGILQSFDIDEGSVIEKGITAGRIDSSSAWLKRKQLLAQRAVINSRIKNVESQLEVQNQQRINLQKEVDRIENLLKDNAATQQQWDEITGRMRVLDSQTEAIKSQKRIIIGEQSVLEAQLDEIDNTLDKYSIVSPISGTVLEKYADAGELVTPGKALFKVADLNEMELRVYVSGSQLSSITLGDSVTVRIDGPGGSLQPVGGVISWIASKAEFTPKIIQTREERVNMVYAVKIRVKNDGRLKIGMPGEVSWRSGNR